GIFSVTPTLNTGGGFGILPDQTLLFILISLITILFLALALRDSLQQEKGAWKLSLFVQQSVPTKKGKIFVYSISMILAGALGNLVDRLRLGAVIDFIDFKVWPVFNIADSSITIGVIILAWQLLKPRIKV
ncbi:MAG: signal peptidase II, partial [Candidatus Omnitrophota bacterium]